MLIEILEILVLSPCFYYLTWQERIILAKKCLEVNHASTDNQHYYGNFGGAACYERLKSVFQQLQILGEGVKCTQKDLQEKKIFGVVTGWKARHGGLY